MFTPTKCLQDCKRLRHFKGFGYIRQLESPDDDASGMFVERIIDVRYIHGAWMAEDISYLLASP
jgi:hypothetical protein